MAAEASIAVKQITHRVAEEPLLLLANIFLF